MSLEKQGFVRGTRVEAVQIEQRGRGGIVENQRHHVVANAA